MRVCTKSPLPPFVKGGCRETRGDFAAGFGRIARASAFLTFSNIPYPRYIIRRMESTQHPAPAIDLFMADLGRIPLGYVLDYKRALLLHVFGTHDAAVAWFETQGAELRLTVPDMYSARKICAKVQCH